MTTATLGLAVDSSGVTSATPALERMAAASLKAEAAAGGLARAAGSTSGMMKQFMAVVQSIERDLTVLVNRTVTAGDGMERFSQTLPRISNNARAMGGSFAGIASQFQDIGVTAAMGMSPAIIALQQGTQIAGQMEMAMANGGKATAVFGAALRSLLSPVSLLSIGLTALIAFAVQWGISLFQASSDSSRALADQAMSLNQVKSGIGELQQITDDYAKAIRGTAKDQEIATRSILANSEKEFNAKKSLLELELKRQEALISSQKLELAQTQAQIGAQISTKLPTVNMDEAQGYSDPRTGTFVRSRARAELLDATRKLIDANPLTDKVKELQANIALTEVSTDGLKEALTTTFSQGVADSVAALGSTAATAAEKMRAKYDDLVLSAHQRITASELEAETLGMTTEQINAQRYAQDLLNKAANDNIALTSAQVDELTGLGAAMAAAEEAANRLAEIYEFGKDTFRGFFSDLKGGIEEGKGLWESLGNAAANALQKIADKALSMAADGIFDMIFGALKGSLSGGFSPFGGAAVNPSTGMPALFANGAVFNSPSLSAYSQGVFDTPQTFAFANGAGVFAEAGRKRLCPFVAVPMGGLAWPRLPTTTARRS